MLEIEAIFCIRLTSYRKIFPFYQILFFLFPIFFDVSVVKTVNHVGLKCECGM